MKCPQCHTDNPSDSKFCKECATPLPTRLSQKSDPPSKDFSVSHTQTLQVQTKELTRGSTLSERYEVIEELGRGGMGRVYRAVDKKIDEEVALKLLNPQVGADKRMIQRFKNELKLARKIAHRNVCRMYHLGEEEGTSYITMEYVPGEDLKSFIRRSEQLSIGKAISIGKQVCNGLAEAHRLGVVHRDLKPQNIMIDKEGNAKIMDFGIARSLGGKGLTGEGVVIGTPDYMSPEQVEGKEADQRSDIYALGVILYEMATGRIPFEGKTPFSVAVKHKTEAPRDPRLLNSQIPDDLSVVILKCLEKEREQRYQSVEKLLSELINIEKGLPTTTKVIPKKKSLTAREVTVTFGLKKTLIPAIVVLAAVVIIVVVTLIIPKKGEKGAVTFSSDKPSLAVLYFKNNTGEEEYDFWRSALSDSIITDLQQSKYINVLRTDQLLGILRRLSLLEVDSYADEDIRAVADEAGVNHILQGSLTKAGENFRINVTLQEATTGELIGSETVDGKGEASIITMIDELSKEIKADLNLTPEQIAADLDRGMSEITTNSLEAYKYYIEGRNFHLNGEYQKSISIMQRAISIDPEFAMAYLSLGKSYRALGDEAESMKYQQKALDLSDRLSDREKLMIQGDYYSFFEKNKDKAVEAFEKLVELYPNDWSAYESLGWQYAWFGKFDKAIELYEVAVNNNPNPDAFTMLAICYCYKGLYDVAREILQKYIDDFSDNAGIRFMIARTYVLQRDFDRALEQLDKAFSLDPTDYSIIYERGYIFLYKGDLNKAEEEFTNLLETKNPRLEGRGKEGFSNLYNLQGKFKKSIELFEQNLSFLNNIGSISFNFYGNWLLANLYLLLVRPEEAVEHIERMKSLTLGIDASDRYSLILVTEGDFLIETGLLDRALEKAIEHKEQMKEGLYEQEIRDFYYLMGRIEHKRGNYSRAIEYYEKGIPLFSAEAEGADSPIVYFYRLAEAYLAAGHWEKAQEKYEEILKMTYNRKFGGFIYARSFYMLGKVFEQLGDTTQAIEHYEKFLDLWKDADPGLPEVDDAKTRLAGLKK